MVAGSHWRLPRFGEWIRLKCVICPHAGIMFLSQTTLSSCFFLKDDSVLWRDVGLISVMEYIISVYKIRNITTLYEICYKATLERPATSMMPPTRGRLPDTSTCIWGVSFSRERILLTACSTEGRRWMFCVGKVGIREVQASASCCCIDRDSRSNRNVTVSF